MTRETGDAVKSPGDRCVCGDFATPGMTDGRCRECRAVENRKADWLRRSGITPRHARLRSWEDLRGPDQYRDAIKRVTKFVGRGDSILALIGQRGTGKTQIAAVAIRETILDGRQARMVPCLELLADLKRRFGESGSAELAWLADWSAPWLLVIDEFGIRLDTDWTQIVLPTLIDRRYAMMRPTMLIANASRDEFARMAGASIVDRLNEGGGLIVCNWRSFRAEGRAG